ncbi:Peroxiredoxin [Actinomadura meyerae]|jgi:peroxiredoxin|uniref:thioredoxin-dependent peroxiredoxin n=1 Tax=Actinomadura meyerae TaxID=240840 RepID=A0A239NGM9_9ACTN|nr:peroxiredoxin-like family protein [Actinomadura meyerae]SNT53478.1 Peroxiredoxin [Actinomadura meyerae]
MADAASRRTSLREQLEELAASVNRPEDAKAAINRAFADIEEQGLVPGLAIGDRAPDFELPDARGGRVRLADRLATGPVVLTFYRGSWCPYCNLELRAYQSRLDEFAAQDASLIAVSPQAPDDAMSMSEKNALEYDVLSDVDQHVLDAYRIRFDLPAGITAHMLDSTLAALAKQQPDGHYSLPVPATFVLDRQGTVRARHVSMAYRTRMEPDEALAAIREINAAR